MNRCHTAAVWIRTRYGAHPYTVRCPGRGIPVLVDVGSFEARKKMKMHPVAVEEEERDCLGKIE